MARPRQFTAHIINADSTLEAEWEAARAKSLTDGVNIRSTIRLLHESPWQTSAITSKGLLLNWIILHEHTASAMPTVSLGPRGTLQPLQVRTYVAVRIPSQESCSESPHSAYRSSVMQNVPVNQTREDSDDDMAEQEKETFGLLKVVLTCLVYSVLHSCSILLIFNS